MRGPDIQFSVVIPVHNGGDLLRACLRSVAALDFPKSAFEVIVVDNKSTDDTAKIIDDFKFVRLSETRHQSSYAARNVGIRAARGAVIAFTDADCEVALDWLTRIDEAARANPQAGCIAGEILSFTPTTPVERYSDHIGLLRQRGPLSGWHFKPYAQTANAAYRREVFDRVGLFDPEAKSGGDAAIAWRMLDRTNYELVFAPEARVFHHHRTSAAGLWSQFRRYGGGKLAWAKEQRNYRPPSIASQEAEIADLVEKQMQATNDSGLSEELVLFPLLNIVTKAAHLSGYLQELLRHTYGEDSSRWLNLALKGQVEPIHKIESPQCPICGGRTFQAGPGGRLAGSVAPQCANCGSLERHRALHSLAPFFSSRGAGNWRCLTSGESHSILSMFGDVVREDPIPTIRPGLFDVVLVWDLFSRTNIPTIEGALSGLVERVAPNGLMLIVTPGASSPRTVQLENGAWKAGNDFDWIVSRALPFFAVLNCQLPDAVTSASVSITLASLDSSLLEGLCKYVERLSGKATFISL